MIKVLVSGACGRMGQAVVKAVMEDQELQLVAAVDIKTGIDAGEMVGMGKSGIIVTDNLDQAIEDTNPEVMVDFTRPDVVYGNAVKAFSKIYSSQDAGLTWQTDTTLVMPTTFAPESDVFAMTIDADNFIWLVSASNGQIWRGRLNKLGWANKE